VSCSMTIADKPTMPCKTPDAQATQEIHMTISILRMKIQHLGIKHQVLIGGCRKEAWINKTPDKIQQLTSLSCMPGSTVTCSVSDSRAYLTLLHCSHSCVWNCWNMPGPSCFVTILFLQLHCRLPLAGLITFLSLVICDRPQCLKMWAQQFAQWQWKQTKEASCANGFGLVNTSWWCSIMQEAWPVRQAQQPTIPTKSIACCCWYHDQVSQHTDKINSNCLLQ